MTLRTDTWLNTDALVGVPWRTRKALPRLTLGRQSVAWVDEDKCVGTWWMGPVECSSDQLWCLEASRSMSNRSPPKPAGSPGLCCRTCGDKRRHKARRAGPETWSSWKDEEPIRSALSLQVQNARPTRHPPFFLGAEMTFQRSPGLILA